MQNGLHGSSLDQKKTSQSKPAATSLRLTRPRFRDLSLQALSLAGLLLGICFSNPAIAQGEHARRVAAELRVLKGDLTRLESPALSAQHQSGLRERILGGISALDILFRLADQETGKPASNTSAPSLSTIKQFRQAFDDGELDTSNSQLNRWLANYPLALSRLEAVAGTDTAIGKNLHQDLCAACHDRPALNTTRPAYNLFDEAAELTTEEFSARLLVGVRGDRVTGIDNPLSDQQLKSLAAFYTFGDQK